MRLMIVAMMAILLLSACKEEMAEAPTPHPLTEEALSFFCQMNVLEHGGPKAQIHLEGQPAPLFFAQVRDGVAYLRSPERDARVSAVYVSDMHLNLKIQAERFLGRGIPRIRMVDSEFKEVELQGI